MADDKIEPEQGTTTDNSLLDAVQEQMEEGLERSGMFIYLIDRQYRFRYVSSTAAQSLGLRAEKIIGKTPDQVGIPDDIYEAIKGLVNATLEGRRTIRGIFTTNVRGMEQFEFDSTPIFAGGTEPEAILALVFDRTSQVREQKALEAIARVNDHVRSSPDPDELVSKTICAVTGALDDDAFALVINNGGEWRANHSLRIDPDEAKKLADEIVSLASKLINSDRSEAILDVTRDPRGNCDVLSRYPGRSILVVPVRISDRVRIVLLFVRFKVLPYKQYEIDLGEKIASSVAVAVNEQLILQELRKANDERQSLINILAKESEKLISILDAMPVAIGLFENEGTDFRLTLCNTLFRNRILHAVPRPLEGKRCEELATPLEVERIKKMVGEALTAWTVQISQDHMHSLGEVEYPAQVMIAPISRDPVSFLLVGINTTELVNARKQVEEYAARVDAERVRLRAIIDNLPVGVVLVDANGKVLEANHRRVEIWGNNATKDNIIDQVRSIRAKWSNNGMPVTKDGWPISRALKNGEFIRGEMIDVVRADGRRGTEMISAAPIHDSNGKRIGAVGIVQDVTDQRQLEHEALEAKERAEMYLDLLTHDIQGHNAAISGYIQLAMVKDKHTKKRDELQKALDAITASSDLIDTMRKIQMVEMHDSAHGQIELSTMLEDVISDVHVVGGERIHIEKHTQPDSYTMASSMIKEAFWNILINCVKHSEGDIHIKIRQNHIYDGGREYHKFIIEDDGPGIPDDVKPKVFLRKYRGRTKAQGSGLGLYLTKRLVEEHGGKIWVEDRVPGDFSQGTRFIIHLPALATPMDQAEAVPPGM
ncbi:MAG: PAS domain-containing protein [Methanomassiliicoccus sp.]|nr:PAS domain-containing protein [Methanomassiliicoccus sp.]